MEFFVIHKNIGLREAGLWRLEKLIVEIDLVGVEDIIYFLLAIELMDATSLLVGLGLLLLDRSNDLVVGCGRIHSSDGGRLRKNLVLWTWLLGGVHRCLLLLCSLTEVDMPKSEKLRNWVLVLTWVIFLHQWCLWSPRIWRHLKFLFAPCHKSLSRLTGQLESSISLRSNSFGF